MSLPKEVSAILELALLKTDAGRTEIEIGARLTAAGAIAGVAVNSSNVVAARQALEDKPGRVIAMIGFPLGAADADVKRYEIEVAVDCDAQELVLVPNHARLREGNTAAFAREIRDAVEAAEERPLSVLLETTLLSREQLLTAATLADEAQAKGVTLSALFGGRDLAPETVTAVREALTERAVIRCFAHVADAAAASALIAAGANRLLVNFLPLTGATE
jgi:deoxyribose-phosphate aldolase